MKKEEIDSELKAKMDRLQSSLVTLRTVGKWKAEDFAKLIGLTARYYGELEKNDKSEDGKRMTVPLYYCFLYHFEKKAAEDNDFKKVFDDCLNNETISENQCATLSKYIAEERKKNTDVEKVKNKVGVIIGVGAVAASVIAIIASVVGRKRF